MTTDDLRTVALLIEEGVPIGPTVAANLLAEVERLQREREEALRMVGRLIEDDHAEYPRRRRAVAWAWKWRREARTLYRWLTASVQKSAAAQLEIERLRAALAAGDGAR